MVSLSSKQIPGSLPDENKLNSNIIIIGVLFFVFGFVTWLGSVLIPYLKIACELNTFESYFVAFSFYISYALMAIPSAWVLRRTGSKKGMAVGLVMMAIGALLFIPAAMSRQYLLFLLGLFVQGAGLTILQSASNPYVTMLGPLDSAAKRISFMGICNGIAGVMAPLILGSIILSDGDSLSITLTKISGDEKTEVLTGLAHRVILPYLIMMVVLLLLALLIYRSGLPEIDTDEEDSTTSAANSNKKSIFQFPHLLLGVATLFLYVGVEVIAVDTIFGFALTQGVAFSTAKYFTSFTILNMLVGYVIGILCIPRFIQQQQALKISALAGIVFAAMAIVTHGVVAVTFIGLLGLANSLMWPSIWPLALKGLGRFTKIGSSLLIMAIGGGAIVPLVYGRLAQSYSPHMAYWIVLPGYIAILYYAVRGHKVRTHNIR
jgi:MFS transporter, FHS family, L-fucose permease